jgi:hypothetical protein
LFSPGISSLAKEPKGMMRRMEKVISRHRVIVLPVMSMSGSPWSMLLFQYLNQQDSLVFRVNGHSMKA